MNYLIIYMNRAFYTNWFDAENNFMEGMIIVNQLTGKISFDGIEWNEITQDHL